MKKLAEAQIETYLHILQEFTPVGEARLGFNKRTRGRRIHLKTRGGNRITYEVELLDGPPTRALADRIAGERGDGGPQRRLILTPFVSSTMAKVLMANDIDYVDGVGNCHLTPTPDHLVHVEGRSPVRAGRVRTMRPQGYQVLFALLARPGLIAEPIRGIAVQAGVGKTVVGHTIERLEAEGQVFRKRRGRTLFRPKNLLPRWLTGYADALRPGMLLGHFQFPESDRKVMPQRIADYLNGQGNPWGFGGTVGADLLTQYYRGTNITVHVEEIPSGFTKAIRALPAREGELVLIRTPGPIAYQGLVQNVVHPLHVYTELMCSSDERAVNTARLVLEQYLPELV